MIKDIKRFQIYILVFCFILTGGCASLNPNKINQDGEKKTLSLWGFPDAKKPDKTSEKGSDKVSAKNNDNKASSFDEKDPLSQKKR